MTLFRVKILFIIILPVCMFPGPVLADGGYFSYSESIAVSSDQRAIMIRQDDTVSITYSTAYSGDGRDFGWVIPVPAVPETGNVFEAGEPAEKAFRLLDEISAPILLVESGSGGGGGCFPAGTEVMTPAGSIPIEEIEGGTVIVSYDFNTGAWVNAKVSGLIYRKYTGDLISLNCGDVSLQATGNHPFFVSAGEGLSSRPTPEDVPDGEPVTLTQGRWVEARDLETGDVLYTARGRGLRITGLSVSEADITVYNLAVEGLHNYAVCREGILVHNKGSAESESAGPGIGSDLLIKVHGHVTLEDFEISILEAYDAGILLNWLRHNGYRADASAVDIFEYYINKGWSFVAVKMNPDKRREYENEFLPPLTIQYEQDDLVFPLRISSVSTGRAVTITLYILSDSTVGTSNLPMVDFQFPEDRRGFDPEIDWEKYMRDTLQSVHGPGLVRIWGGRVDGIPVLMDTTDRLVHNTPSGKKVYLTRLETIMTPDMMEKDIELDFSKKPEQTRVVIHAWPYSALMTAIRDGNTEEAGKLLAEGYDPDTSYNGFTALEAAVREKSLYLPERISIVGMLLDAGADVNYAGETGDGSLALLYAARDGYIDIVRLLLEKGAAVDAGLSLEWYDGSGKSHREYYTPLGEAVERGYTDIVTVLLEAGADVYASEPDALEISGEKGFMEIMHLLLDSMEP